MLLQAGRALKVGICVRCWSSWERQWDEGNNTPGKWRRRKANNGNGGGRRSWICLARLLAWAGAGATSWDPISIPEHWVRYLRRGRASSREGGCCSTHTPNGSGGLIDCAAEERARIEHSHAGINGVRRGRWGSWIYWARVVGRGRRRGSWIDRSAGGKARSRGAEERRFRRRRRMAARGRIGWRENGIMSFWPIYWIDYSCMFKSTDMHANSATQFCHMWKVPLAVLHTNLMAKHGASQILGPPRQHV